MCTYILADTVITIRPSEVKVKLRKKEKNTSDVKQNPVTDGVGTLVVLALSLCLSVPRRIQTSCVSQRQMPMATPWNPGLSVQSVMDWLDPLGSFAVSFDDNWRLLGLRHGTQTSPNTPCSCTGLSTFWTQKWGACKKTSPHQTAQVV